MEDHATDQAEAETRTDIYQRITNQIAATIEAGPERGRCRGIPVRTG